MTKTIDEILSYEHDVEGCQALHSGSKCLHCNEDPCPHCKRWGGRQRTEVRSMVDKKTKQAITSLIKELVAEAEADIKLWVDDEVIGSDERHSNGKKMVNYWSCEDCGTPEEAWTRNQLRADQRKRLWLEKFEQNLLKALEEV